MTPEMFQYLPWPFPSNKFPADLGAVVMLSVLEGVRPALQVLHVVKVRTSARLNKLKSVSPLMRSTADLGPFSGGPVQT
jgi:hypothetical protein